MSYAHSGSSHGARGCAGRPHPTVTCCLSLARSPSICVWHALTLAAAAGPTERPHQPVTLCLSLAKSPRICTWRAPDTGCGCRAPERWERPSQPLACPTRPSWPCQQAADSLTALQPTQMAQMWPLMQRPLRHQVRRMRVTVPLLTCTAVHCPGDVMTAQRAALHRLSSTSSGGTVSP